MSNRTRTSPSSISPPIMLRRTPWLWLLCAWMAIAVLVFAHSRAYWDYIGALDRNGRVEAAAQAPEIAARSVVLAADTQMWAQHAAALTEGAGPQLRYTYVDNAPYGREVHWDSGFAWALAAAGYLQHLITGEPVPIGIEHAIAWFNAFAFLACCGIVGIWFARHFGLGGALIAMFGMVGYDDFYNGFAPTFVDHHGLLSVLTLGMIFGAVEMGSGILRPGSPAKPGDSPRPPDLRSAHRAAIVSALCGGVGMWISAPTLIPAIALVGLAGAAAIFVLGGRAATDVPISGAVWRLWGRVGAGACVAFYAVEYAPGHFGLRLEVNHPLYALAWWGGSEFIAQLADWRTGSRPASRRGVRLIVALVAVLAAPLIIAVGGAKVFVVSDPFVAQLSQYVLEGFSLAKFVRLFGPGRLWIEGIWSVLCLGLGWVAFRRAERCARIALAMAGVVVAAFLALALFQVRWWPSAAAAEIAFVVVATEAWIQSPARSWRRSTFVASAVLLLGVVPAVGRVWTMSAGNRHQVVDPGDAMQPLYRDVAAALKQNEPTGDIVVLSSPNASSAISYYGRCKTIGTLYWENLAGTKAAAEIFSAASADEARFLVRDRRITHVAMLSEEHFLAQYYVLLHPGADAGAFQHSFGYDLLVRRNIPLWLEPVPYAVPEGTLARVDRVALYRTRFQSASAEDEYAVAAREFSRGNISGGAGHLEAALKLAPGAAEFWVTKARLMLGTGHPDDAFKTILHAVECAPISQRLNICATAAAGFHQSRCYVEATELCRRGLAVEFEPMIANNLVWLLSTCTDDRARNGVEALELSNHLARDQTGFVFLSARAAAFAECGQFDEAIATATRAVEAAQASGSGRQLEAEQRQLATYREHRAWRE